jgi:hypothetical protein
VAVKRFIRERAERATLIDEVKGILLDGSSKRMERYRKSGLETVDDFLKFFMSLGNMAFHSGDPEVIRRFLGSLFELAGSGRLDGDEVVGRIRYYGLRSIHGFDYDSFALILDNFVEYVCGMRETVRVNESLGVLRSLALRSVSEGFEAGVGGLVDVLVRLDDHFMVESLHVNRFYLRNLVVSLVCFAGRSGDGSLRGRIISDAGGILGVVEARPPAVEAASAPVSEEVAGTPSPVG